MRAVPTALPEVLILEPRVHEDERGTFFESYRRDAFRAATGIDVEFVQDNHSISGRGVLRGLHYQLPPATQGKLVRVVAGAIHDVAVDVRAGSPTRGRSVGVRLDAAERRQLWIPAGFAHGFLVLAEGAEVLYKTTAPYDPERERSIRWDDPELAIEWPLEGPPRLSPRDAAAPAFTAAEPIEMGDGRG